MDSPTLISVSPGGFFSIGGEKHRAACARLTLPFLASMGGCKKFAYS
ncbi:hypothetical protein SAMN03159444_01352 [Pseudomonas sp. NFACC02]|nr:hypothetical protein SAMN03159444_01352 [Pseudomonas sp. NFACC02]